MLGGFSSMYMSRNRVRSWDEQSFTIQAGGRHAPLHPQAPKMEKVGKDKQAFISGYEHLYRRLSIRECARVQSFPDNHKFCYKNLSAGYNFTKNLNTNIMYVNVDADEANGETDYNKYLASVEYKF